jgi:hypothetical protein
VREVYDTHGLYRRLWEELGGRGTEDIERAKKKLYLRPIHTAFRALLDSSLSGAVSELLYEGRAPSQVIEAGKTEKTDKAEKTEKAGKDKKTERAAVPAEESPADRYAEFLDACLSLGYGRSERKRKSIADFEKRLAALDKLAPALGSKQRPQPPTLEGYLNRGIAMMPEAPGLLLGYVLIAPLEHFIAEDARYPSAAACAEDLMLPELLHRLYREVHIPEEQYYRLEAQLLALTEVPNWNARLTEKSVSSRELLEDIIRAPYASRLLRLNRHLEIEWFHGEALQELLWWITLLSVLDMLAGGKGWKKAETLFRRTTAAWLEAEERAEYRVELLLEQV